MSPGSAPDGYTLLIATSSLAINPSLYPDAAYDPRKDFAPIGLIATSPNLVLVPRRAAGAFHRRTGRARQERSRQTRLRIDRNRHEHASRARPFAAMADVKFTAIPYKGVAPAITDLLGRHVALMFCPMASVVGRYASSNFCAIAVTGCQALAAISGLADSRRDRVVRLCGGAALRSWSHRPARRRRSIAKAQRLAQLHALGPTPTSGNALPPMAPRYCRARRRLTPPISPARKPNGAPSSPKQTGVKAQ